MNLACGEDKITHDGDFKHEEKRFALAFRSNNGVVINGTQLSPAHIKQLLRLDPAIPSSRLDALFDNSDHQSIPKAHTLLKGIYNVSQLPEIQKQPGHKPFVLLGELLYAFIAPYTTPSMSLSQQVVYLAKCAFLLFVIFRLDSNRFITSQLYYDIQTTIKTAIFNIVKTQILDPMQPFYLIQLGTDRLENLFGIYRTASHDRNLDILQLAERSGAAQEPYRLSLKSEFGIDHLNPRSWTGDVRVCNVNLSKSWSAGHIQAEEALRRAGITPEFDPKNLHASTNGLTVDLMRPFGHYVGVNESIPNAPDEDNPSSCPQADVSNLAPTETAAPAQPDQFLASDFIDVELETPLEDLLPPPSMPPGTSEHDIISTPEGPTKRGWIKVDGRHVRLESATRLILGTTSTKKSTDRLRRVRGYTRYPSAGESDSILGDFYLIGQPILGLVRVDDAVALAAARVVSIQIGSSRDPVEALSLDHLDRPDVVLTGQILKLDFSFNDHAWYWNQSYVTSPTSKKGKQSASINEKPLLVQFRSHTIELTNPVISEHLGQLVWSFGHDGLVASMDLLWAKCSETLHEIPVHPELIDFPYHWETTNGQSLLVHDDASQAIELMPAGRCGVCYLCHRAVPVKKCMRVHIAKHILAKRLHKEDPLLADGVTVVDYAPCGFCGRSGVPECRVTITSNRKSTRFSSGCPFYDKFSLKSAETPKISSPCTNRPMRCEHPGCPQKDGIWSYNMRDHILAAHGQAAFNRAVHEGQYLVTSGEIELLQLEHMFIVPGKPRVILPTNPVQSTKRSHEDPQDSTSTIPNPTVASAQQGNLGAHPVASGSGPAPKRARTTN